MAKILMAWELGAGFGHLVPLRSLATQLIERGHEVSLAARDLVTAGRLFEHLPVKFYQAPHRIEPYKAPIDPPITYGQMLHNIGFGAASGLYAMASAWQTIFAADQPDVVLFEHSPTALFASRSWRFRKAMIGTGFTAPPIPLPLIRPWLRPNSSDGFVDHQQTVNAINLAASRLDMSSLDSIDQVYEGVSAAFLRSYPEFDHFGPRQNVDYVGIDSDSQGKKPKWPYGDGPKIFAYLRHFQGFRESISQIYKLRTPSIVFCPTLRPQDVRELEEAFPSIVFATEPLSIELLAHDCDIVVCYGSHGMVARMVLAGIPVIAIPFQLEQTLLSHRLSISGAGVHLAGKNVTQLGDAIHHVLSHDSFRNAARQIASKYAATSERGGWAQVISWIEETT